MNLKIAAVPILALVISLSTMGLVNAQSNTGTGITNEYNQTSSSCSQDEITAAKQGLSDIQKKMADVRTQYYADWQNEHNSGQYNGTFQQYSREKISSSDISQIKSDYQKYNSILRSCGVGHMMRSMTSSSTTCSQDDLSHARQELASTMKQGMDLRNKIYQHFHDNQSPGQSNGTWSQYAKENFYNLPEVAQLKSTHDKYTSFLNNCFGTQMPSRMMPNQGENYTGIVPTTGNNISSTGPQSLSTISNPTDALGTISSSHTLPGWVKGIAAYWAQGKISDDEFVNAIKFLVHQGIIKI